jgi:hypothetical protein
MRELQWYLETFLDYLYPPETEHAERAAAFGVRQLAAALVRPACRPLHPFIGLRIIPNQEIECSWLFSSVS